MSVFSLHNPAQIKQIYNDLQWFTMYLWQIFYISSGGSDEEESEMEQEIEVANGNQEQAEGDNVKEKKKEKKPKEAARSMSFDSSLPSSHTVCKTWDSLSICHLIEKV